MRISKKRTKNLDAARKPSNTLICISRKSKKFKNSKSISPPNYENVSIWK